MAKRRLDLYVAERFALESRRLAQNYIIQGLVSVCGREERKPGYCLAEGDEVVLRVPERRYASRGGLKLEKALDEFGVDPSGLVCIDAGASNGGFTDCLLKRGAARVYAVDVGKGQLEMSLRNDPRVVVLDGVNVRYLDSSLVPERAGLVTVDVSFISLEKVFPALSALLRDDGVLIALVKPQFEAGRGGTKRGVVRDAAVHESVLGNAAAYGAASGLWPSLCTWSPVKGPSGNIEFLMLFSKAESVRLFSPGEVVRSAWGFFGDKI